MPIRSQFESEKEWLEHLRIYFAAKAMQAIRSNETALVAYAKHTNTPEELTEVIAASAYMMADAMLKARDAKTS